MTQIQLPWEDSLMISGRQTSHDEFYPVYNFSLRRLKHG